MNVFSVTRTDPRVFTVSRTADKVFSVTRTDPRVFTVSRTDTPVHFLISSVSIPATIYLDDNFDCTISLFNLTITGIKDLTWELVDTEYTVYSSGVINDVTINTRSSETETIENISPPSDGSLVIAIRVKVGGGDWVYSNWVDLISVNIPDNPTPRG